MFFVGFQQVIYGEINGKSLVEERFYDAQIDVTVVFRNHEIGGLVGFILHIEEGEAGLIEHDFIFQRKCPLRFGGRTGTVILRSIEEHVHEIDFIRGLIPPEFGRSHYRYVDILAVIEVQVAQESNLLPVV